MDDDQHHRNEVILKKLMSDEVPRYGLEGALLKAVKENLAFKIDASLDKGHVRSRILNNMVALIPAIIQSEKIKIENVEMKDMDKKEASKQLQENDDEEDDFVAKLKKCKKTKKKDDSKTKYFLYLSEYKKDKDLLERVQGLQLRGKTFRISNDGSCPKCRYRSNVFVILDILFMDNDMPEMLQYLIAQGKACLWSSKDDSSCKDPPTFLCGGRCPSEINKSGFNINWETTDLEKIFLFPETNFVEKEFKKRELSPEKVFEKTENEAGKKHDEKNQEDLMDIDDDELTVTSTNEDIKETAKEIPNPAEGSTTANSVTETENSVTEIENSVAETENSVFETEKLVVETENVEEFDEDIVDFDFYRKTASWVVLDEEVEDKEMLLDNQDDVIRTMFAYEKAKIDHQNKILKTIHESVAVSDNEKDMYKYIYNVSEKSGDEKDNNSLISLEKSSDKVPDKTKEKVFDIEKREVETPVHVVKNPSYYQQQSEKKSKRSFTAADFPISKDGACPYCHSNNVIYIIIDDKNPEEELPELLSRLLREGYAKLMPKGNYDLPSFQCNGCTYGFNLDWTKTNLEKIFPRYTQQTQISGHAASNVMNPYHMQSSYYYPHTPYISGGMPTWGYNSMSSQGYGAPPLYQGGSVVPQPYNMYGMASSNYSYMLPNPANESPWQHPQQWQQQHSQKYYKTHPTNIQQKQITSAPPVDQPVQVSKEKKSATSTIHTAISSPSSGKSVVSSGKSTIASTISTSTSTISTVTSTTPTSSSTISTSSFAVSTTSSTISTTSSTVSTTITMASTTNSTVSTTSSTVSTASSTVSTTSSTVSTTSSTKITDASSISEDNKVEIKVDNDTAIKPMDIDDGSYEKSDIVDLTNEQDNEKTHNTSESSDINPTTTLVIESKNESENRTSKTIDDVVCLSDDDDNDGVVCLSNEEHNSANDKESTHSSDNISQTIVSNNISQTIVNISSDDAPENVAITDSHEFERNCENSQTVCEMNKTSNTLNKVKTGHADNSNSATTIKTCIVNKNIVDSDLSNHEVAPSVKVSSDDVIHINSNSEGSSQTEDGKQVLESFSNNSISEQKQEAKPKSVRKTRSSTRFSKVSTAAVKIEAINLPLDKTSADLESLSTLTPTSSKSLKRELVKGSDDDNISPTIKKKTVENEASSDQKLSLSLSLENTKFNDDLSSLEEVSDYMMDEHTLKENKQMWTNETINDVDSPFTDLLVNIVSDIFTSSDNAVPTNAQSNENMEQSSATHKNEKNNSVGDAPTDLVVVEESVVTETKKPTRGRPKRGRGRGRGRKKK